MVNSNKARARADRRAPAGRRRPADAGDDTPSAEHQADTGTPEQTAEHQADTGTPEQTAEHQADTGDDTPSAERKLCLPVKPVIRPVRTRPVTGSVVDRETRLAQAALVYYHGLGHAMGAIDGWPGPRFAIAVRLLQQRRGARVADGILGPETWPMILS
jgi:hypothetical protein